MTLTRPTVLIVGGGAAGSLVALHLTRAAGRRSTGLDLVVFDPREPGGVAFGTHDERHLLNVPAAGMSALPEDPGHFVTWRRRSAPDAVAFDFAPRREFHRYLDETLHEAVRAAGGEVSFHRIAREVLRTDLEGDRVTVTLDDGSRRTGDAVVLASGLPPAGVDWAPETLRSSAFFVPDPWARGALDVVRRDRNGPADVLVVGTGLTMVDVAMTVTGSDCRPDRTVRAISRSGRLPRPHADRLQLAAIPDVTDWPTDLDGLRDRVGRHLREVRATSGDWRPAMDGLRFQASVLWSRLSEEDRAEFLVHDAGAWNGLRHRMPRSSARWVGALGKAGRLGVAAARVATAEPLTGGGLRIGLDDGSTHDVGWVVNCTGPQVDITTVGNPLLDDLVRPRAGLALATPATAGMGFVTDEGRLVDTVGTSRAPIWTLGALRRGELWESTAVPEIRTQALALAVSVLDAVAPLPRALADGRVVSGHHPVARPRDPLGLAISTTAEAAVAYNAGIERLMRLQSGAEDLLRQASEIDPDFALAHAALAMLGHEAGATCDVAASLQAAESAVSRRGDERERSLVDVVRARVRDARHGGAQALMAHIARHPRDVLAVSSAVPTIAFSGVIDVQQEAWELVEGLSPAYGDHWWYISLLAFTRQDQGRFDEAGLLAEGALSCEPTSGHAVHAQTHVLYETGQHQSGLTWLDHWVAESGRAASHRAHFSWHAALHELALGDLEAVRRRYYSQLAPPSVGGVRSLIDSAALLWRWRVTVSEWDDTESAPPPVEPIIAGLNAELLDRPATPFVALHAAIALAAVGDVARLQSLAHHCRGSSDATTRTIVTTVCLGLLAAAEGRFADAVRVLSEVLPVLVRVGGSAAQREVIEETVLMCQLRAGDARGAAETLHHRLDRRPSPLDQRRLERVTGESVRV